jgi:hypothetical protein
MIEIEAGDQIEITAIELEAPTNKYLIFVNKDVNENAEVEIVLV